MPKFEQMFEAYKELGAKAFRLNHYELPLTTSIGTASDWKEFLQRQDVSDYINKETNLLQDIELRKIILDVADASQSVGRAQLINALIAVKDKQTNKEGDVVIYSYIQPNEQQKKADNVVHITEDPFLK